MLLRADQKKKAPFEHCLLRVWQFRCPRNLRSHENAGKQAEISSAPSWRCWLQASRILVVARSRKCLLAEALVDGHFGRCGWKRTSSRHASGGERESGRERRGRSTCSSSSSSSSSEFPTVKPSFRTTEENPRVMCVAKDSSHAYDHSQFLFFWRRFDNGRLTQLKCGMNLLCTFIVPRNRWLSHIF